MENEELAQLNIKVPREVLQAAKHRAIDERITLTELIVRLLRTSLQVTA